MSRLTTYVVNDDYDHLGLRHPRLQVEHLLQHLLAEAHQHRWRLQFFTIVENLKSDSVERRPSIVWGWPRRKWPAVRCSEWFFHR